MGITFAVELAMPLSDATDGYSIKNTFVHVPNGSMELGALTRSYTDPTNNTTNTKSMPIGPDAAGSRSPDVCVFDARRDSSCSSDYPTIPPSESEQAFGDTKEDDFDSSTEGDDGLSRKESWGSFPHHETQVRHGFADFHDQQVNAKKTKRRLPHHELQVGHGFGDFQVRKDALRGPRGGGWVCICGFKNCMTNENCGGNGPMGCKMPRNGTVSFGLGGGKGAKVFGAKGFGGKASAGDGSTDGEWVCTCGFKNRAANDVCGGKGALGCKQRKLSAEERMMQFFNPAVLQEALAQTPGLLTSAGPFPVMFAGFAGFPPVAPLQPTPGNCPRGNAELLELTRKSWQHQERLVTDDTSNAESTRGPPFQDHCVEREATTESSERSTHQRSNIRSRSDKERPRPLLLQIYQDGDAINVEFTDVGGNVIYRTHQFDIGCRVKDLTEYMRPLFDTFGIDVYDNSVLLHEDCDVGKYSCLTATARPDRPSWWSSEDESMFQERSAVDDLSVLPSLGSALHPHRCRPCAFLYKGVSCRHGHECFHCHTCVSTELKSRKREKLAKLRSSETRDGGIPTQDPAYGHTQQPSSQPSAPPTIQQVVPAVVFMMAPGYSESSQKTNTRRGFHAQRL